MSTDLALDVTAAAWEPLRQQIEQHGGLMVPVQGGGWPELFSQVTIAVHIEGRLQVQAQAQVVQVFAARSEVAVLLPEASRATLKALTPAVLGGGRAESGAPGGTIRSQVPPRPDEDPVWKQMESASKMELIRLARQGNEAERRQILKERDASLHLHILNNPGTTPREIAQAIRAGGVQLNFLQRVLERSDLVSNAAIAEALVLHPLTPVTQVTRLIDRLHIDTVRRIAKSTDLRQPVVAAAKKRAITGR